jgi:hypothetical protein
MEGDFVVAEDGPTVAGGAKARSDGDDGGVDVLQLTMEDYEFQSHQKSDDK